MTQGLCPASYEQFATGYYLTRKAMEWFWDAYTTDPAQRAEIGESVAGLRIAGPGCPTPHLHHRTVRAAD